MTLTNQILDLLTDFEDNICQSYYTHVPEIASWITTLSAAPSEFWDDTTGYSVTIPHGAEHTTIISALLPAPRINNTPGFSVWTHEGEVVTQAISAEGLTAQNLADIGRAFLAAATHQHRKGTA